MKRETGNALFLILIAVALFAALSYAVTNSGRGGGSIDKEQASIAAAQVVQYAGQIEQAINRLRIINGCSDTEISFHFDSDGDGTLETDGSDDYYNPISSTDCYVFHSDGAGLVYQAAKSEWLVPQAGLTNDNGYGESVFSGVFSVDDIGSDCSGTEESCRELSIYVPHLSKSICDVINKSLDITSSYVNEAIAGFEGGGVTDYFNGTYGVAANSTTVIGDQDTVFSGKTSGCLYRNWHPGYAYYHVLIAR